MYDHNYAQSNYRSSFWALTSKSTDEEKIRLHIHGNQFILRNVQFYPYFLNEQVIYRDLGYYKDVASNSRYDFGANFGAYTSSLAANVCSKL